MGAIAQNFYNYCVSIADNSNLIVLGVFIVALIVVGIMLMLGEENRKKAMKAVPWMVIGAAVVLSAVTIATAVTSGAAF